VARQFRLSVGVPAHQYLLVMRIKLAQRLLPATSDPIAEIAFACGFSHQEHLTRLFGRWCGTTPPPFFAALRNFEGSALDKCAGREVCSALAFAEAPMPSTLQRRVESI
jgi:AraC family transcriptional regulator